MGMGIDEGVGGGGRPRVACQHWRSEKFQGESLANWKHYQLADEVIHSPNLLGSLLVFSL